jgi:hypothetical protein
MEIMILAAWRIWIVRNNEIFKDHEFNLQELEVNLLSRDKASELHIKEKYANSLKIG